MLYHVYQVVIYATYQKLLVHVKQKYKDIIMMLKLISVKDSNIVAAGVTIIISKRDEIAQLHVINEVSCMLNIYI